ncbi:MAG: GNAT family N-acetyltransferase [Thermoleophilaceae bacterium]
MPFSCSPCQRCRWDRPNNGPRERQQIALCGRFATHTVWVAVEGAVIGWVEVDRDRVAALYVSPSCSRRGVGSALLARAETSIQSSGYATARLESSQNALDFCQRPPKESHPGSPIVGQCGTVTGFLLSGG